MPMYLMRCACGYEQDIFRKLAEIDRDLPEHCGQTMTRAICAPFVQADLQAYRAVGVDKKTGGLPMIEGRKQHREYLQRNGYREVGNDLPQPKHEVRGDFNVKQEVINATKQHARFD